MKRFVWVGLALAGCGVADEKGGPNNVDTATLTTTTSATGTDPGTTGDTPPTGTGPVEDVDQDGVSEAEGDCADDDEAIYPGADDVVGDAVDANCDGHDGVDADQDGFADLASGGDDCDDADGAVTPSTDGDLDGVTLCGGDCDDAQALAAPGFVEECDGIDNDCAGDGDEAAGVHACAAQDLYRNGGAADILFLVDNSCSMAEEQSRMGTGAAAFFTPLQGLDYHVGVITTDMDNANDSGRLQETAGLLWLDATTPQPDAEQWFAWAMLQGTGGSGNERGLDAVEASVAGPAAAFNAGFERPDASLFVVVLSDESDYSTVPPGVFTGWYASYKLAPAVGRFHSLVAPNPVCVGASTPGTAYTGVSTSTGGLVGSVCDPDYAPFMDLVANDVLSISAPTVLLWTLTEVADPATITVTATAPDGTVTVLTPADWVYDAVANTIEILGVWGLGTTFTVDYLRVP